MYELILFGMRSNLSLEQFIAKGNYIFFRTHLVVTSYHLQSGTQDAIIAAANIVTKMICVANIEGRIISTNFYIT